MSTDKGVEMATRDEETMTQELTVGIQSAAEAVMEAMNDGIDLELRDHLDQLRETLAEARRGLNRSPSANRRR